MARVLPPERLLAQARGFLDFLDRSAGSCAARARLRHCRTRRCSEICASSSPLPLHRSPASIIADHDELKLALRQFRKSPGFAATVILTISLGIGANTAIFTLVHAILMKSLPVTNPATLYRIGDLDDCCVNGGFENDNGDFDLFSYDLYRHFQETTPEFEQLAAFQSGHNMMNVRRGTAAAKSERTEYVSGNYFSTFGLGAYAGRMLLPSDDVPGAAPVAVLSYAAWQAAHAGDPNVIGSTFYIQNQPFTIVGIAPPGFFGDRIDSNPPALWIPLNDEPVIEARNQHSEAARYELALRSGPGETRGQSRQPAGQDCPILFGSGWPRSRLTPSTAGETQIPKQHVVVDSGRRRHTEPSAGDGQWSSPAYGDLRPGAAGGVRQHRESSAGQRRGAPRRDFDPHGARSGALPPDPPDADGKLAALAAPAE